MALATVDTLIESLTEQDIVAPKTAMLVLGKIGQEAKDTVPALNKALQDYQSDIGAIASHALKKIALNSYT